jgi:Fe-S oxidoreductase
MLVREGRLPEVAGGSQSVTFHDPCYAARHHGVVEAPRELLRAAGVQTSEMARHGRQAMCCGAGGAQFWKEEEEGDARVADVRYAQAEETEAELLVTGCPFCRSMLTSATAAQVEGATPVRDLAVVYDDALRAVQERLDAARPNA